MKRTIEKCFCDVCNEEAEVIEVNYPVIFHTLQDDGASCKPYVTQEKLDLCGECAKKLLVLHGWGVQGHNNYEVKYNA